MRIVDRPHERLGRVVRIVRPRLEALDRAVLADMPERRLRHARAKAAFWSSNWASIHGVPSGS